MFNRMGVIRPYLIGRIAFTWAIGFAIDFSKRLLKPVFGPLDLPFKFIWAIVYRGGCVAICLILGLVLLVPFVNRIWYRRNSLFWAMVVAGVVLFQSGVIKAHHAYFDLQEAGSVANWYLSYLTRPGYFMILFALCFRPHGRLAELSLADVEKSDSARNEVSENNLDRWLRERAEERKRTN